VDSQETEVIVLFLILPTVADLISPS